MARSAWRGSCAVALLLAVASPARGEPPGPWKGGPKVEKAAFAVAVERHVLGNGLVVLLAPDPAAANAAVWMSFRAGALYEPAGRAGLAHLTEHVMAAGPTPETDYAGLLERRRVQYFNASTSVDRMTFEAVVPFEELPAALWVARDRLTAVPPLVDAAVVERNRRAVLQERELRDVDEPYGLFGEQVMRRAFAAPHPLEHGVIGLPEQLAQVSPEDVRRFVADRLVPANGILTVTGRFEPAEVEARIEELFGGLPPGRRAQPPALPAPRIGAVEKVSERLGRCPRVRIAWRLPSATAEEAAALDLGAVLFTFLTDQAFDMRVGAELVQYDGESAFFLDVMVPYDEPIGAVHGDAEGFLRQLTAKEMPAEVVDAGNLALDRLALQELDAVWARAELLTAFEHRYGGKYPAADLLAWHWQIDRFTVRDTARQLLRGASAELHARPTRPRPAHKERE